MVVDLIVELRPGARRALEAGAELHALYRVDGEDGLGQAPVELAIPVHVAAEPKRHAARDDAERPAEGVPPLSHLIDVGHHALRCLRVGAAHG